jgi:hypothetical protein
MSERSIKIRDRLFEVIHNGELSNDDLVQIVEYIGNDILNLKTKSNYHKDKISKITGREKSYNSHKFAKGIRVYINNVEFIIDND